jgi:hypothetical protein
MFEHNHRRNRQPISHGADKVAGFLNHQCLARQHQINRSWNADNAQRFPSAAVQQQDLPLYHKLLLSVLGLVSSSIIGKGEKMFYGKRVNFYLPKLDTGKDSL